jgi:hypothetical protein
MSLIPCKNNFFLSLSIGQRFSSDTGTVSESPTVVGERMAVSQPRLELHGKAFRKSGRRNLKP